MTRPTRVPRDYSTISESALSLLVMKAHSAIAFAEQASTLLWQGKVPEHLAEPIKAENARRRLRHFENRYRSLDSLIAESGLARILEIGAGFSFRGLELARTRDTFYVDTDLPDIATAKARLIAELHPGRLIGTLRVQALDALDGEGFRAAVDAIPKGPLAIANEGLLMYLDRDEKALLGRNVRTALQARGGTWLTADIYIQTPGGSSPTVSYGRSRQFLDRHRVEQNKFLDFADAERFFTDNGFEIANKQGHAHPKHIRESWALTAAP